MSPSAVAAAPLHVFIVVMENSSAAQALAQPYTASLARTYGQLTGYHAVAHPSLPNYLALTSGTTWGITDDGWHVLPRQGIGDQLDAAHLSWRAYMQDLPADCRTNAGDYAVKHDPFAYYGGDCPSQVVPFTSLRSDLAGADPPHFIWITPNLCEDTHNCPSSEGDQWLATVVPEIQASSAWRNGGLLFITWDEDRGATGNRVATLVISPTLRPTDPAAAYDHRSLLATVEDRLGLPRLAPVASTPAIALCC